MILNEELAIVASFAKKIDQSLHPLQHIHVTYEDKVKLGSLGNKLMYLAQEINQLSQSIQQQHHESIPEQKPPEKSPFAPLPSTEYLTRMRKYDDNNKRDFFTEDH